jgi:hypothetical protein
VNHNTIVGTSEQGLIGMSETESSYAGQLTACRSNLIYGSTTGNYIAAIRDVGAGTPAVDAVTLATHNYFRNASLGTCVYNTSTSQGSVAGYDGVKISLNDDYPNAQVGANDGTISADPFVDVTRTFAKWAAFKGQSETSAAGVAYAIANPAAATHATTGLLAWVRAGHKVTGAAGSTLQNAGHDGVTVGALAFQAAEDAPTPVLIQSTDILVI